MTIADRLGNADDPVSIDDALRIWLGAVRCVRYAVGNNRYHRRLMLSSFVLNEDIVELTDEHQLVAVPDSGASRNPAWLLAAPEQTTLVDGPCDLRTNVYNLGVLGALLCFRGEPYDRDPSTDLERVITSQPVRFPREDSARRAESAVAVLEHEAQRIITVATDKDPGRRYPDLASLEAAITFVAGRRSAAREARIVGRQAERSRLQEEIAGVRRGGHRSVAIIGEPGIGKSVLWDDVEDRERREAEFWFRFKSAQSVTIPYRAIGALLDALLPAVVSNHPAANTSMPLVVRRLFSRISARAAEQFAETLDGEARIREESKSTDPILAAQIAGAIAEWISAFPCAVIVIDDLQWLDSQSVAVVHRLVAEGPPRSLMVLIGRPEARLILPAEPEVSVVELAGLSRDDAGKLLERNQSTLALENSALAHANGLSDWYEWTRGNPLALVTLVGPRELHRPADRRHVREWGLDPADTNELLVSLAAHRITALDEPTLTVLRLLSLLQPPVPAAWLEDAPVSPCDDLVSLRRAWDVAESAALVVRTDDPDSRITFAHDTIELAIRREAIHYAAVSHTAALLLNRKAEEGVEHAVFALAELLMAEATGEGRPLLDPHDEVAVLRTAARRSHQIRAAAEALRFSVAALNRNTEQLSVSQRVELHAIAHDSAFLQDDAATMSRHFRALCGLGDAIAVNEARRVWISRAIAKSSFVGSLRVAVTALGELGVSIPLDPDEGAYREELRALNRLRKRHPERRLAQATATSDPRAELIIRICVRSLFAVYVIRPRLFPYVIRIIIETSLRFGPLPQSGMAFLYWAMLIARSGIRRRDCFAMGKAARVFLERGIDDISRNTLEVATLIVTEPWGRDYRELYPPLADLYRSGVRLGNLEWAGHAGHLYCVGKFFTGAPLPELLPETDRYRREFHGLGLARTAGALAKYQQTIECLLGRTANEFELTGTLGNEAEDIAQYEREGDSAALSGMYELRAWLGIYHDRPQRALESCRMCSRYFATVAPIPDTPVIYFLWGMSAWQMGALTEARSATRRLRVWSKEAPVNQEHRYHLLCAERSRWYGRHRPAVRHYRRAIAAALSRGYLHEAALACERLAGLLHKNGAATHAESMYHQAQSLYSRWGAVHAVDRVRRQLGWHALSEESLSSPAWPGIIQRLVSEESLDSTLRTALTELVSRSATDRGYLRVSLGDRDVVYRATLSSSSDPHIDLPDLNQLERYIIEELDGATDTPRVTILEIGSFSLSVRSEVADCVTITVALVSGTRRPSPTVIRQTQTVAMLVASVVGVIRLAMTNREQHADLDVAREELVAARRHQEVLLGAVDIALVLSDDSSTVLTANDSAADYLVTDQKGNPQLEPEFVQSIGEVLATVRLHAGVSRREIRWKDRWLRVTLNRTERATALAIEDITAARLQEERIDEQRRQLIVADRMSSLGMLAAATAHEVGNPNHILQLNLQALGLTLKRLSTESPDSHEALQTAERLTDQILEASRKIEGVIRSITEYGRAGRTQNWEACAPNDIATTAVRFARILAAQYTDSFSFRPADDLPPVRAVPGLIEQALINVIKNSCEALRNRGERVDVQTDIDTANAHVVFRVGDQGKGIPDAIAEAETVFLTEKSNIGGSGLGLSIVRTIVGQHNGSIRFRSDSTFSTIVEITIPVLRQ